MSNLYVHMDNGSIVLCSIPPEWIAEFVAADTAQRFHLILEFSDARKRVYLTQAMHQHAISHYSLKLQAD